jgi:hypothetical protein
VCTAGNVIESGNEFGGAVQRCVFEEGVGEVVVTASFKVGWGGNERSDRDKEVNGVSRAAKG